MRIRYQIRFWKHKKSFRYIFKNFNIVQLVLVNTKDKGSEKTYIDKLYWVKLQEKKNENISSRTNQTKSVSPIFLV